MKMSYSEKLQDIRWQKKKSQALAHAGWKCEDCSRKDGMLSVHHCCYIRGREPWEYDLNLLMALCDPCHQRRQQREDSMRVSLGMITRHLAPHELEDEVWKVLQGIYFRQTERYAEAFGA